MLRLLRHDRVIVGACIGVASVLAWSYLFWGAGMEMSASARMRWSAAHAAMILAMWWIMMVAMMLPSAASMILLFAALDRHASAGGRYGTRTALFAAGYVLVWGAFSLVAVALQWGLDENALLSSAWSTTSRTLGGVLLLGAGIWQFTPMKRACLGHCRSPATFLTRHRRSGATGALIMGVSHGGYCLGCCWLMMLLLFYGGVMNLLWIIGLTVMVAIEKLAPPGPWTSRAIGLAFAGAGTIVLASS